MTTPSPIVPAHIQSLRKLGLEEIAMHLEHAYLLVRSQSDALGDIVTHAAETLQTEKITDFDEGGELGNTLLYIKDTVEENYNNTRDLEVEFAGTYQEVVARREREKRDLVATFLDYVLVKWSEVTKPHALSTTETAEQLIAEFFARIETGRS
jgi:hypothetical protein